MDENLKKVYEKLLKIRATENLKQKPCSYLKDNILALNGQTVPLELRPYQLQAVIHLLAMNRFVLGDDTGLGKTLETIATLAYLWEKTPEMKVVVLTTKTAVVQWSKEFEKFTQGVTCYVCKGTPTRRQKAIEAFKGHGESPSVLVLGHRTFVQDFESFFDLSWEDCCFVIDEASSIKNPDTQLHKKIAHFTARAKRIWGLTATLIKNYLIEGWGIYKAVVPDVFGSKHHFMENYCYTKLQSLPGSKRKIPVIVGHSKRHIKQFREAIDPFFLGRTKQEVAKDLPPLIVKHLPTEMTTTQREKYEEAISGLLEIGEGDQVEQKETTKLSSIIYCQQIVDHLELIGIQGDSEKMGSLFDLLEEGDFATENVIVYSRFRKMIDVLEREATKRKIPNTRITGVEKEQQREDAKAAFNDPENPTRVIFITSAANEAVNLQSAKAIIFYDSPWSAGEYLQILGRMLRIGTLHDSVYALHLYVPDSIDTHVLSVLNKKMDLINKTLGERIKGVEDFSTEIGKDNSIAEIFDLLLKDSKK